MLSRIPKTPNYRYHKARNLAVVTIDGHDFYLGEYDSQESHERYDRLVAEWLANGRRLARPVSTASVEDNGPTISEIILAFWNHAEQYYRRPDGSATSEVAEYKRTLSILRRLYGSTSAKDFGPLALKAVRQTLIESGVSRKVVNQRVGRVRRVFKWAAENELVTAGVYQGLLTVDGLHLGRSAARETAPVKPVAQETVRQTLPFLPRPIAAMVNLQLLTGARPGEVVIMRGCDLDMSGKVWLYRPGSDEGQHGVNRALK